MLTSILKKAVVLIFALLPVMAFSQKNGKPKSRTINVSTSFNYYPASKPYTFLSELTAYTEDELFLIFNTPTSGVFTLEQGQTVDLMRKSIANFPSQLFGVGTSVQIVNENSLFHEISLTKMSVTKSSNSIQYLVPDTMGNIQLLPVGYKHTAAAFAIRYELGKYFGDSKNAKVRFGISGGLESSMYFHKKTIVSPNQDEYPITARLFTLDVALIPMLTAKLSKKVSLDFKLIPNMLLGDYGTVKENNPILPKSQQGGTRSYKSPDVTLAFSMLLRYTLVEPKKKGDK